MSRLTLQLPETLHNKLTQLAESEGISLDQYILYVLTRQAGSSYSVHLVSQAGVEQQEKAFRQWIEESDQLSKAEAAEILAARETIEPEPDLTPEMVARFQSLIQKRSQV